MKRWDFTWSLKGEWRRPVLSGKRERFGVRVWGELGVVSVMRRWHGGSSGIMGNEKQS